MQFDRDYLEQRAEEELDLAQAADHPAAVKAHFQMLERYLDILYPETRESVRRA